MTAVDTFSDTKATLTSPIEGGESVTPNDSAELTNVTRQLYVGTGGDIVVVTKDDTQLTFTNVQGGSLLDIRVKQVRATNTTASNILALW